MSFTSILLCLAEMHVNKVVLIFKVWPPYIFTGGWWWCWWWRWCWFWLLWSSTSRTSLVYLFLFLQSHKTIPFWFIRFVWCRLAVAAAATTIGILFSLNHFDAVEYCPFWPNVTNLECNEVNARSSSIETHEYPIFCQISWKISVFCLYFLFLQMRLW